MSLKTVKYIMQQKKGINKTHAYFIQNQHECIHANSPQGHFTLKTAKSALAVFASLHVFIVEQM